MSHRKQNKSSKIMEVQQDRDVNMEEHEDGEQEEGEGDDDDGLTESVSAPIFLNSETFSFMTTNAYTRFEEEGTPEITSSKLFNHVRPMRARVGVLENPHGSVRLWQGSTSVLVAVYGPSDVKMSKELPHRAAVDVLFRPKITGNANINSMLAIGMMDPQVQERAIEQTLTSILESTIYLEDHVQAGFNIIVHEFEDQGCLLSTCINACSLALLNAGCSLRCVFAAVTICVCGDTLIVDPSNEQVEELRNRSAASSSSPPPVSLITITFTNKTDASSSGAEVLHVHVAGRIDAKSLATACNYALSQDIMLEVFGFFNGVISNDIMSGTMTTSSSSMIDDKNQQRKNKTIDDDNECQVVEDIGSNDESGECDESDD